jgi:hypothetical protein
LFNRIAGLPITIRAMRKRRLKPGSILRQAYARRFWTPRGAGEWLEVALCLILWPLALLALSAWFLWRNGMIISNRDHVPLSRQFLDQMRLYFAAGVLPPWYYIYELYRRPRNREARSFIYRCESKTGVLAYLKEVHPPRSIVSDKVAFAAHCEAHNIPTVPVLAVARDGAVRWLGKKRRHQDWFVKPIDGKGGKGIERWDHEGRGLFRGAGQLVRAKALVARLSAQSWATPRFIQPRVVNHPKMQDLSNGALATVRALSCLDEQGRPELIGAVLRMAVGGNHVVDNLHAGGIAAGIDLDTGLLGPASNLGSDSRLGWIERHPDSGAAILGRTLPYWDQLRPFVERAHAAFADRVLIGWDIAITANGLVLVEANGAPDLDIMQRPFRRGLMKGRLGVLLAHHVAGCAGQRRAA